MVSQCLWRPSYKKYLLGYALNMKHLLSYALRMMHLLDFAQSMKDLSSMHGRGLQPRHDARHVLRFILVKYVDPAHPPLQAALLGPCPLASKPYGPLSQLTPHLLPA